ncbi:hypothetical protein [Pedobacter sp.]
MKKYLILLLLFIPNKIWSQTYMHEAAEDTDGSPIGGIVSLVAVLGIIYLISKFRKSLKEKNHSRENENLKREIAVSVSKSYLDCQEDISIFQNKIAWQKGYINATYDIQNNKSRKIYNKSIDDLIAEYHIKCNSSLTEADKIMEDIGYFEHLEHNNKCLIKEGREPFNYISSSVISNSLTVNSNEIIDSKPHEDTILFIDNKQKDFKNHCITVYGEYAEIISGLCLSIKEDGEYRIIKIDDERYKPLYDYVLNTHPEQNCPVNKLVGNEFVYYYLGSRLDNYPLAKPMKEHGLLDKEFLGGKIMALEAYYSKDFFLPNMIPLRDYILELGYEVSIYIHKYIKTPMDYAIYYDLIVMKNQKMTATEYKEYKKKAGQTHQNDEGYFDSWWGYLGKTSSEARDNFDRKQGFTYEEALEKVKNIEWYLKS